MQKRVVGSEKASMKLAAPPSFRPPSFRPTIPLLLALIFSAAVFYSTDLCYVSRRYTDDYVRPTIPPSEKTGTKLGGEDKKECDVYSGSWVPDHSRPLYQESDCPYIGFQSSCLQHGRPDTEYQRWRWQPHSCSLPRFEAKVMLEGLRGKRMMFVGDSLNRGQFISMVCLVQTGIPQHAKSIQTVGSLTVFTAKEYNARIEFYWAPFLLESNSDDPTKHRVKDRVIRNGTVGQHGQHWKEADIIVFNTYIWWVEGVRIIQGSFDDGVKEAVKLRMEDGYRIAMNTLVQWINRNIDPKKARVFFVGMSATHQSSRKWDGAPQGNCYNETRMLQNTTLTGSREILLPIMRQEFDKSAVPITLINITELTTPRKEAHTSIYRGFPWGALTKNQLQTPSRYADCIHWCIPGVQDVWNELLFAKLFCS